MRGYIVAYKPELKIREYELYTAYYCGVCRSVGKRYGQIPRLALSYDAAFLAVLISSLTDEEEHLIEGKCFVHPIKKRLFTVDSLAADFAADVMLIMAYGKLDDDVRDEGSTGAGILKKIFKSAYYRLEQKYPEVTTSMEEELSALSELEGRLSGSLDETSACFGRMLGTAVGSYFPSDDIRQKVLYNFGFNLGKWIYLADAADDLEKDIEKNRYNPLIYRFSYDGASESIVEFKNRIREVLELNMYNSLGEAANAFDLLDIKKNEGIVKNVVFLGLRNKTEEVLGTTLPKE